jgi:hypothetical protein
MNVASGASFVACRQANATSEISILFLLLASRDDLLNAWYQFGNTPIGIVSFIVSRFISSIKVPSKPFIRSSLWKARSGIQIQVILMAMLNCGLLYPLANVAWRHLYARSSRQPFVSASGASSLLIMASLEILKVYSRVRQSTSGSC